MGVTWESVNLLKYTGENIVNQTLQFISLYPLKDCLIVAPDTSYNYMFKVPRVSKQETPVIFRTWAFNNTNVITHLTNGYERFTANDSVLILMGRGDNVVPSDYEDRHNFILATFDGEKYWKIWEDEDTTIYPDPSVKVFKHGNKHVIEVTNRDKMDKILSGCNIL